MKVIFDTSITAHFFAISGFLQKLYVHFSVRILVATSYVRVILTKKLNANPNVGS
jgi:hypothetical protein